MNEKTVTLFQNLNDIVRTFKIKLASGDSFRVMLQESKIGQKTFEIVLSRESNVKYVDIFKHSFYTDQILPWLHGNGSMPSRSILVTKY